ncbi:MAG TPA: hypothetical protein VNJ06_09425 [Gemmatimonadales bacterium]|nr:hypothetical protein [Gemmatimonadales bacterium]
MTDRRLLSQRRAAETFELRHRGQAVAVTVGFYSDGSVGEVFITGSKVGSEIEAVARDGAVLLSIAVQHHVPLTEMRNAITRESDGTASTIIGAVLDRLVGEGSDG